MATSNSYKHTSLKMVASSLKSHILKSLPKGFKCSISKTGVTVKIWADTNKVGGWTKANKLVYSLAKKLKFIEIGSGTNMITGVRDWEFIDTSTEKKMIFEAKAVYNAMKNFFAKYGNEYCDSEECYDVINQMRELVATDEN